MNKFIGCKSHWVYLLFGEIYLYAKGLGKDVFHPVSKETLSEEREKNSHFLHLLHTE